MYHARHAKTRSTRGIGRTVAVVLSAVGLILGTAAASTAAPVNPAASGPVRQAALPENSVYHAQIVDAVEDDLMKTPNGSVYWSSLNPGIVSTDKLAADVKDQLLLGAGAEANFAPKPIANMGGSFTSRATVLGTFEMRKGVWSINTTARFDRLDANAEGYIAPTTETYPTLAVRFGDDQKDAGTIMGVPISKAGFVELTGSATKTVNIPVDGTVVTVYGFGYNEDRSDFGSAGEGRVAQFSAAATVTFARLG